MWSNRSYNHGFLYVQWEVANKEKSARSLPIAFYLEGKIICEWTSGVAKLHVF